VFDIVPPGVTNITAQPVREEVKSSQLSEGEK
jgi:hypothetical protein